MRSGVDAASDELDKVVNAIVRLGSHAQ
jgi:hypothetical protein